MTDAAAGRRLRVLSVSLGRRGGVARYGFEMTRALSRTCTVAAVYSAQADDRDRWRALGAERLELDTFGSLGGMLAKVAVPLWLPRVARFIREFAPDVVYYPGGHAFKPWLDLVVPRGLPVVLTVHDPSLHSGEDTVFHRVFDAANRRRVDGYVLLNESQRGSFVDRENLEPDSVAVIAHGVLGAPSPVGSPAPDVAELIAGARGPRGYLLFLGRFKPYKGIGMLLRAYARIVDRTDLALVVAGSGALTADEARLLAALPPGRVFVLNRWMSDDDMHHLLESARFVVLPYTSATQSGVVPLASTSGVPAVATLTGGLPEQVVHGVTGLLAQPDDDGLSAALEVAADMSDDAYARMSDACRHHAGTNWSWDVLAADLEEFLRSRTTWTSWMQ